MPRYCAVKVCSNRGGAASRQDNKRISFYPFPLQDKPRLQRWVDNMKREEWTPSRHQYLCSEHFTEDCFDIRWGIRYLKNTAIPTIFPSTEDDGEKKITTIKRSPKAKPRTADTEPTGFDFSLSKRPLILSRTCKKAQSSVTGDPAEVTSEPPSLSCNGVSCHSNVPDNQAAVCDTAGDSAVATAPCVGAPCVGAPCVGAPPRSEPHREERADSAVAVLCYESLFSDSEASVDAASLQAALGQAFSFVPVELLKDEPPGCFLEERGPGEGEHISAYEHSYCRPDTDRDQLWNKILSLHAKILELDHREESTVAKIRALETEIALLKRDGAVFKEKQKVLEDYISSVCL